MPVVRGRGLSVSSQATVHKIFSLLKAQEMFYAEAMDAQKVAMSIFCFFHHVQFSYRNL
uniref:Uncharacterized protein n=1 Tax=Rhizophora mucronata TaxID=61149 RepID=A0A2P2N0N9_RHIMU